jgi:hypothetical protein
LIVSAPAPHSAASPSIVSKVPLQVTVTVSPDGPLNSVAASVSAAATSLQAISTENLQRFHAIKGVISKEYDARERLLLN